MRCSVTTRRWPATWRTSRTSGRAPYPGTRPRRLFGKVALQPLDPATVDIALAYRVGRRVAGTRVGHKVHRHIVVAQRAIQHVGPRDRDPRVAGVRQDQRGRPEL